MKNESKNKSVAFKFLFSVKSLKLIQVINADALFILLSFIHCLVTLSNVLGVIQTVFLCATYKII